MGDEERKFVWFEMSRTPTTHDSLAWKGSDFAFNFEKGIPFEPHLTPVDSHFTCSKTMIKQNMTTTAFLSIVCLNSTLVVNLVR